MPRISLRCTCGWSFFVSDATLGWQVACPSCGAAVPIPGRQPGKAYKSNAEVAGTSLRETMHDLTAHLIRIFNNIKYSSHCVHSCRKS